MSRCRSSARALEAEAPYFVDYISQELQDKYKAVASTVDVYTTLDLHLQRVAQDAVRDGLTRVDEILAKRAQGPRTGCADRHRSAHRRDPGAGRWPLLQPVAVQPRHRGEAAAGLGLQTVRLPRRLRTGGGRRPDRRDAGVGRHGRTDVVRVRPADVEPGQLRGRVRRADYAPPCAGAVAEHRRDQSRGRGWLRSRRRAVAQGRRRNTAAAVPVDRARGVRSDADRDCGSVHVFPNGGLGASAARDLSAGERRPRFGRADRGAEERGAAGHDVPRRPT